MVVPFIPILLTAAGAKVAAVLYGQHRARNFRESEAVRVLEGMDFTALRLEPDAELARKIGRKGETYRILHDGSETHRTRLGMPIRFFLFVDDDERMDLFAAYPVMGGREQFHALSPDCRGTVSHYAALDTFLRLLRERRAGAQPGEDDAAATTPAEEGRPQATGPDPVDGAGLAVEPVDVTPAQVALLSRLVDMPGTVVSDDIHPMTIKACYKKDLIQTDTHDENLKISKMAWWITEKGRVSLGAAR